MAIAPGIYNTGTATVASGGLTVSFQGAPTLQSKIRPGDRFGGHVGFGIRIAVVGTSTVTLAHPWPGPAQTAAPYEIVFTPYDLGYRQSIESLIDRYGSTAVAALAELVLTADKLPYGNGSDTMALTALTAKGREIIGAATAAEARGAIEAQSALGFTPVQQGGGAGQTSSKLRLGWDGAGGILAQVDDVPMGRIWTSSQLPSPAQYSSSSAIDETNYPIGTIVGWNSASTDLSIFKRNQYVDVRLSGDGTGFRTGGGGAALAGYWQLRGFVGTLIINGNAFFMAQRTS